MNVPDRHALVCLQDTRQHLQVSPAELLMSPVSVVSACMNSFHASTVWTIGAGHTCDAHALLAGL